MRILLTNDDGPPSNSSSPYVHTLISSLQHAGHHVYVCLPDVQRSWIGKAHIVGQTLTASYFRPGTILQDDGIVSERPFNDEGEQWVLINGTPASCVQIGLHHIYKNQGPFDLVLSGPNYGRNTTAVFALSSGTIGGAMEGAVNGVRSIALSYAFDSREHDAKVIAAASKVSTKLIEKLVAGWPEDVQLYSINVPLREGVEETKIVYTEMIQNRWHTSSFKELSAKATDADPNEAEQKIRENKEAPSDRSSTGNGKVTYKWSPYFADIKNSVEESGRGDGWSVLQGHISVTPLRANFWHVSKYTGEIKLDQRSVNITIRSDKRALESVYAMINHPESYVQPLILKALQSQTRLRYEVIDKIEDLPSADAHVLQFSDYEQLDFERAAAAPTTYLSCAYVIRKALIRKHYLSNTISTWLVKHPDSILARHFKPAIHFELDFAEFLDDALVDAWDLNESLQRNEESEDGVGKEWWILKPGMSDGGNGIRLFSTLQELQGIFEEWDPEEDDDIDEEDEDTDTRDGDENTTDTMAATGDYAMTSQLRHFIAQPYIDPPLLLASHQNRKFHIRTYVVAAGALRVYVYREMLALFAAKPYQSPGSSTTEQHDGLHSGDGELAGNHIDLSQHLTNTCFQDESTRGSSVYRFWALEGGFGANGGNSGSGSSNSSITNSTTTTKHNTNTDTNTAAQTEGNKNTNPLSQSTSNPPSPPPITTITEPTAGNENNDWKEQIFTQILNITGEVFEAAARSQMVHFQTLPNAFEIFGVDFLVDHERNVWLLELNAYPDFKQTGADLQDQVVGGLFEEVVRVAVNPFFGDSSRRGGSENMVLVRDIDLGRGGG